MSSVTDAEILV